MTTAHPVRGDLRLAALDGLASLPPFSPILARVLASLSDEEASYADLSSMIEKDPVLAGNVLSLANSALYSRRSTIYTVKHAIAMIGAVKVRNTVLAISLSRMWNRRALPASWSMTRFNTHSVACAIMCDQLSRYVQIENGDAAFAAGLLHDLGHILTALTLPREHLEILRSRMAGESEDLECEREVVGFDHAELSCRALEHWRLPSPILTAARDHHASPEPSGKKITLSRAVEAANNCVNSIGISVFGAGMTTASDPTVLDELLANDAARGRLMEAFRAEYTSMLQFFR